MTVIIEDNDEIIFEKEDNIYYENMLNKKLDDE